MEEKVSRLEKWYHTLKEVCEGEYHSNLSIGTIMKSISLKLDYLKKQGKKENENQGIG